MGKKEAVELLNEIVRTCVFPKYIALEPVNPQVPPERQSFELKIGKNFDANTWNCLKEIIKRHNLNMKETGSDVIIYRQL